MAAKDDERQTDENQLRHVLGAIYGQCVGDAIGLLTEFLIKDEAKKYYGKVSKRLEFEHKDLVADMHRTRWETGDWTDDSDQMILILQSILDNDGTVDPVDFAKRLLNWTRHGYPELGDKGGMGIGKTTSTVVNNPRYLDKPHEVAETVWRNGGCNLAPNGAAMRTSILGIHMYQDLDTVVKNTLDICKTTHADPRCQASCVAVTVAIALMLQGKPEHKKKGHFNVDAIIGDCFKHASTCLKTDEEKQELKSYLECRKIKELQLDEYCKIGYTYKCIGAAFWAFKQDDFRKAIQKVVMEAGDADTNACVAGALLGCKLGVEAIPTSWKDKLRHKDWLDTYMQKFLQMPSSKR